MNSSSSFEPDATAGDPTPAQPLSPVIAVAAAATYPHLSDGLEGLSSRP